MLEIIDILFRHNNVKLDTWKIYHLLINLKLEFYSKSCIIEIAKEGLLIKTRYIAVIPTSTYFSNNRLFDLTLNRDNRLLGYIRLKEFLNNREIIIQTIDLYSNFIDLDCVIFEKIDYYYLNLLIKKFPNIKRVFIPWEPEVVETQHSIPNLKKVSKYFNSILTWNDYLIDNKKFFKINYPQHLIRLNNIQLNIDNFNRRRLLVQVSSNLKSKHELELYSLRRKMNLEAHRRFQNNFNFFGSGWDHDNKSYKGLIEEKLTTISRYRFSLCFENTANIDGYITEKIFDCFVSGVVPIYFGARNITDYIPKKAFIDFRDFESYADLFNYISEIDYEVWLDYINEGLKFISSKDSQIFSISSYIDVVNNSLQIEYDRYEIPLYNLIELNLLSYVSQVKNYLRKLKYLMIRT